ncbi:MAG: anaerobic sulfatase maturase [Verrucomicrobiota bacterium]|nr:anaerobic sulfatase maturase [Verrucomicrobiota bacterium]
MKDFSLLIKPTSADCNIRCNYCFYLKKHKLYPDLKMHRMSNFVLDKMISSFMALPMQQHTFGWQGGEPTLMGVDFFRRVTSLQEQYGKRGTKVSNGLQTNGTLIDDALAKHLAKYNFLVGVSLDGPPSLHNTYRKDIDGKGTHEDVIKGIRKLDTHNVEYNILTLLNSSNIKNPEVIYRYLCDNEWFFQQYIPCVEFDSTGNPLPWGISGEEYGLFLSKIFDLWYKNDTRKVSIRFFDSILSYLVDGIRNVCQMGDNCCQYLVVEYNGDIYPCDFFVLPELKIGNITKDSWESLLDSEIYKKFGAQKHDWNQECKSCKFLNLCQGDCLKHRIEGGRSASTLSWLCKGKKIFYEHTLSRFKELAAEIKTERLMQMQISQPLPEIMPTEMQQDLTKNQKVGRNDPCPCGSGKKFKKCCGLKNLI